MKKLIAFLICISLFLTGCGASTAETQPETTEAAPTTVATEAPTEAETEAPTEMIAAEIGGWSDLSTMHNIYTHLAQKDIAKRSSDFCDYFTAEAMKKRKLATELETKNKNC